MHKWLSDSRMDDQARRGDPRPTHRKARGGSREPGLLERVEVAYLSFARLQGSTADPDQLAGQAAWACWRLRRRLRVQAHEALPVFGPALRLRAAWITLVVRWWARPNQDVAAADLVRRELRALIAGIDRQAPSVAQGVETEAMARRRAELVTVLQRAEMIVERLQQETPPLWQSFIPGRD